MSLVTPWDREISNLPAITLTTPIFDLDPEAGRLLAEHCKARVAAFEGEPAYEEVLAGVKRKMGFGGWLDEPVPPGLFEAKQAILFIERITFDTHPVPHVRGEKASGASRAAFEATDALIREIWVEVAILSGADEATSEAVAALAGTWQGNTSADWRQLLAAARRAAS